MSSAGVRRLVEPPLDAAWTRRARDELRSLGLLALPPSRPGVREVIERSWRRCVGEAVPTSPPSISYRDATALQPALQEAAAPVLDRLGEHLADVRVAMFVSDESGRIVLRRAHEPRQRTLLDRASAAEGFDFSETSVGTNGLGTVVEERRPLVVRGTEHYNDLLEPFTCAGTPIFEPFTRRLLGTFSLASDAADASPLMYGIATDVGRQIEANLTAMLGAREQQLIRAYLMADQAEREPVIVVNERTVFANTAGLPFLTSESHALLWAHLREAPPVPGPQRTSVPLPAGWQDAVVEAVDGGGHPAYCIRLLPGRPADVPALAGTRTRRPAPDRAELRAHPVAEIDRQLATAARHRENLALDGGPGTGKLHAARALLAAGFGARAPLVLDVATFPAGRPAEWFEPATAALDAGSGVVLRHLQDLAPSDVNRVKALAEHAAGGIPLVVTADLTAAAEHVHAVVGQLATTVRLPALRDMHRQIPELVSRVLAALPAAEAGTRFSSDALQTLMSCPWPGNVAELRRTVEGLAARLPGRTVRPEDLPAALHSTAPHRRLTLMETAERQAIVTALQHCGGNRSRAAAELGIGRTTLYRKMQQHHLTP